MTRRHQALIAAPAIEPVTLDELIVAAKIDSDAAEAEESLLASYITTARLAAEEFTRRAFITQAWRLSLDLERCSYYNDLPDGVHDLPVSALYGELPRVIELPRPNLQAITSVVAYAPDNAASTLDPSHYSADTAGNRFVLAGNAAWPANLRPQSSVAIAFTCGYGDSASDVPAPIRSAILLHAKLLYDGGDCDCPAAGQQLLRQYRVMAL